MKCERCWSDEDVAEVRKPEDGYASDDARYSGIPMCQRCRATAPRDTTLLRRLYVRFASRKEMLQHYGASKASDALLQWCSEVGMTLSEVATILADEADGFEILTVSDLPSLPSTPKLPFGYADEDGYWVPSPSEGPIVKTIFKRYSEESSLGRIAAWLNGQPVPTRRKGGWHRSTVHYILRNPLYAGYERRSGHLRESRHPALVDREIFEEVQVALSRRCRRPDQRRADMPLEAG